MSSVIAAGGLGKERQKISTRAAVMRATSLREGAFSRRLMVGWEQRSRPLSGARPTASLKRGSPRRASQSSASFPGSGFAGPRTGSPAGDREHAEAQHRRQRVDHPLRVAPLPDAARQRLGQAEPALRRAQQDQPAVRRDRPALEIGGHLLALYGWKIEREKAIFGHGGRGAFVASLERRWTTNFYPITTTYATFATTSSRREE